MAVSESLSSVSDTIFNLNIIHRTDMQGNISVRHQAEDKLQLYASVFRHAREGIMISDIEGTILDVNESFTRITGYSREEAVPASRLKANSSL